MECLKCGHRSKASAIRCTACGTTFDRAAFDELSRIRIVLEEAAQWARDGIISQRGLRAVRHRYQSRLDALETQLDLRPPPAPLAPPAPPVPAIPLHLDRPAAAAPPVFEAPAAAAPPDQTELSEGMAIPTELPPAAPAQPITWQRLWKSLFAERALDIILYLGALLFVTSVAALVIRYWAHFLPFEQILILLSGTGVFYAGGWIARSRLRALRSGTVIIGIGALLVPLNAFTIARVAGIPSDQMALWWLGSSLVMLPLNLLTAVWLQEEFFAYVAAATAVTAVASGSHLASLPTPWWGAPIVVLGVVFVLVAPRVAGGLLILRRALRISGSFLGLLPAPWLLWAASGITSYLRGLGPLPNAAPVAAAWWGAALLGAVLTRQTPERRGAYATVAAIGGAAALTASAVAAVPWISLALVALAPLGTWVGTRLAPEVETAAGIPCRQGAWVFAGLGGAWSLMSLDTMIPALGIDAAVSVWWARLYRRWWLSLLGLVLLAVALTAAMLRAHVPSGSLGLGWLALAVIYLGVATLARIPEAEASALYLTAYGLIVAAQIPSIIWPSRVLQVAALGMAIAVSAWSIRLGDRAPGLRLLLGRLPPPWHATVFVWIAAALFPLWSGLVWSWRAGLGPAVGAMLCVLALLYAAGGYRLMRRASPWGAPLLWLAYALSAAGPLLPLNFFDRPLLTLALLLDTVLFAGLAVGFDSRPLAALAAVASSGAILAAPSHLAPLWGTLAPVAFAALFAGAGRWLGRLAATQVFEPSCWWAARVFAGIAWIVASSHAAEALPLIGAAGYGALALTFGVWSLMDEEPWSAVLGALLATGGVAFAVNGGLLLRVGVVPHDYGQAWAALALGLGGVGISLGRWRRAAAGLLPIAGTVLSAVAMLQSIERPSSEWWSLLFALILYAACAAFLPQGRLPAVAGALRRVGADDPGLEGVLRSGYTYLVAWLLPFWVYLSMGRVHALASSRANLGVGLVLLAWGYLAVSRLARAAGTQEEMPWLVTAPIVAGAGLLIAVTERLPFVLASGAAALLCAAFAGVLRSPRWLYPAAFLAAPSWVLGLAHAGLPTTLLPPSLLCLAVAELALAHWLDRRSVADRAQIAGMAVPLWIVGFTLMPPAFLWASISGRTIALATFLAGAAVYVVAGLRFRDSLFSYPATVLLGVAYVIGVSLLRDRLQFPIVEWSAWLLPGVAAAMLAAIALSRFGPRGRSGAFFLRSPAAPLTVLASGGALAAMVIGWSEPWLRVWVATAAAGVYVLGIGVSPAPGWLYPALLAGHLAYGFAIADAGLAGGGLLAVRFMPVVLAMSAAGAVAARGRDRGEGRSLVDRMRSAGWGRPFFLFAAAGVFAWTGDAAPHAGPLALVLATGTVAIAALGGRWRDGRLASLASVFGVAAVVAVFRWRQVAAPTAEMGMAAIALGFGELWWLALMAAGRGWGARAEARFWAGPLRLVGVLLSVLALGGSTVGLVTGVPGADRAFVVCLALVGFFILELAVLEEREVLSYAAVLMLELAWALWLYHDRGIRQIQFYAIPGALSLLWVGLMQHRRARPHLAATLDGAGLILLLGSSLLQSVTQALASTTLAYGALVAVEALGVLWWGLVRRLRRFVFAGVGALIVDIVAQGVQPLLSMSRWVLTAVVGLTLVLLALLIERQREAIKKLSQEWWSRMEEWD